MPRAESFRSGRRLASSNRADPRLGSGRAHLYRRIHIQPCSVAFPMRHTKSCRCDGSPASLDTALACFPGLRFAFHTAHSSRLRFVIDGHAMHVCMVTAHGYLGSRHRLHDGRYHFPTPALHACAHAFDGDALGVGMRFAVWAFHLSIPPRVQEFPV